MCRLFGLTAAPARITATFWLAEAPYRDTAFAREGREVSSTTFLAHVRYATTGALRTCCSERRRRGRCSATGLR